jgi:hypothetical protein
MTSHAQCANKVGMRCAQQTLPPADVQRTLIGMASSVHYSCSSINHVHITTLADLISIYRVHPIAMENRHNARNQL